LLNFKDICLFKNDFKRNEKILAAHLNKLRGPPVEKHWYVYGSSVARGGAIGHLHPQAATAKH